MLRRFKKWAAGKKGCEPAPAPPAVTEAAYHALEQQLLELQTRFYVFLEDHGRQYGEHQHILASTMLGVGTNLTAAKQPASALNFQRIALAVSPTIVDGYRQLFETCIRLHQPELALEAFGHALNLPVAEASTKRSAAPSITVDDLLQRRRRPSSSQCVTIFTSLMPRRFDVQKAAVESWLRGGFVVRSVNVRKEIDELTDVFPKVDFVEFTSKKGSLAPIDHLCRLMAEDENPIIGLVNSDIIFLDATNLLRQLESEHLHSLVFGHRQDLQSPADTIGQPYREGFDYFFMERESWRKIAGTCLLMGAPWWDYWVPLAARLNGLVLKKVEDVQIVHMMHPFTYDVKTSLHYARSFWRDFAVAARSVEPGAHDEFAALLCRAGRTLTAEPLADTPENFNRLFDFGFMAKVMIDAGTNVLN
jgi:hypothetical protein